VQELNNGQEAIGIFDPPRRSLYINVFQDKPFAKAKRKLYGVPIFPALGNAQKQPFCASRLIFADKSSFFSF